MTSSGRNERLHGSYVLGAVIELIEFAYFTGIYVRPAMRNLRIKMHTLDGEQDDGQIWFQVKVSSYPSGSAFDEIKKCFMKGYFKHLRGIVSRNEEYFPDTHHLWDKLYERENLCRVRRWRITPPESFTESLEEKSARHSGWSLYFMIFEDVHKMKSDFLQLIIYLQKLKLTSPVITIMAKLNIEGNISQTELPNSNFIVSIGSKRLEGSFATDLGGDDSEDTPNQEQMVVKPRIGATFQINTGPCIGFSTTDTIKVNCVAWLHPPPMTEHFAFNPPVSSLKVLFFGSGEIPLSSPGCDVGSPSYLFDLRDYGMTVIEQNYADDMEVLDLHYKVTLTEGLESTNEEDDSSNTSYSLVILVYLTGEGLPMTRPTDKNLGAAFRIRQSFTVICSKFRNKIRKAVSTALNKILQNYRTTEQKQSLLETSIPVIMDALTSTVKRSTNDQFRNECFLAAGADNTQTFQAKLHGAIWSLTTKMHNVKKPLDPGQPQLVSQQKRTLQGSRKRDVETCSTDVAGSVSEESQPNQDIPSKVLPKTAIGLDDNQYQSSQVQDSSSQNQLNDHQPLLSMVHHAGIVINNNSTASDCSNIFMRESCGDAFSTLQYIEDLNSDCPDKPSQNAQSLSLNSSTSPQLPVAHQSPGPNWYSDLLGKDF